MRLEKIKLAGFKSFVDPTTVTFPSNLVGVVGPNGCGKSNVIDAVRWVMGESSAKMLRGESMADVIFNGSTSRKPVGTAGIELLFDNSDGRAGGQYAQYSQISVKRQVARDGQSNYFLNGVRCRRRDIADLFLGTGLGPRSYSIIEQGMISRVIEARPEELRAYLEEAAGISKYKERRRETERRIEHTRENLDRLKDLRDEVAKQLRHLERQAATAEKYKVLKGEERQSKGELQALRWQVLEGQMADHDRTLAEQENRLEKAIAAQRHLEAQIEQARSGHLESQDRFNTVQGRFYGVGSEIARLQEAIQYARESRRQHEEDLVKANQALANAREHQTTDEQQLEALSKALSEELPELEKAELDLAKISEELEAAEGALSAWQVEWDSFNQKAAEPAQQAQVERARINHLESRDGDLRRRLERLGQEQEALGQQTLDAEIAELEERNAAQQADIEQQQAQVLQLREQIDAQRASLQAQQQQLADDRGHLGNEKARLVSLQTLQEEALGQSGKVLNEWLAQNGLESARRLAQVIQVDSDWQVAVEQVLDQALQAVCVDDLDAVLGPLESMNAGRLSLVSNAAGGSGTSADSLAARVQGPAALLDLLAGVGTATDLADAQARRSTLAPGQSLITPAGEWFGRDWVRVRRGEQETGGVLAREQEIRDLTAKIEELEPKLQARQEALEQGREQRKALENERERAQLALDQAHRVMGDVKAALGARKARAEQLRQRRAQLDKETADLRGNLVEAESEMQACRERLHDALAAVEQASSLRETLVARREKVRGELNEARQRAQQARGHAHTLAIRVESRRSSESSLRQALGRVQDQLGQLDQRCDELRASLAASQVPLAEQEQELERQLAERVKVEAELTEARKRMEEIANQLRELEQQRGQSEQAVGNERERLDKGRMARQEVAIRARTLAEDLDEQGFDKQALLAELEEGADVQTWQQKVERLGNRIQRLGAINLAAIDEFKEQSERMEYLDAQHEDITKSLETLEEAIRKIDRETRTRFKETFDKVDAGLKEMFPKLFGGGHAYLEMTGDDLLDAGVSVMARPPGKRNTSIHLLSGGEKALSAVALVFSIFKLNPAPFCMLDEVDAPLDDANVGRFCRMVEEMSEEVQFIFITHNKITMEIAHHLSGVTMHEPGVSRLVTVNVDEAAQMVAV